MKVGERWEKNRTGASGELKSSLRMISGKV